MSLAFGLDRPQVTQQIITFPLTVIGGAASQGSVISSTLDKSKLITAFTVSNPVAGSSVYLGGAGVQATGPNQGLEIPPGTAPTFRILQEDRQLYELQSLLSSIAEGLMCKKTDLEKIPIIVWDLTTLFLFSAAAVNSQVTIAAYPLPYL